MARVDKATRVIQAPPERVFAAMVDRDALTAWLPPAGMSGRFERVDIRPGGSYRFALSYDDPSGPGVEGTLQGSQGEAGGP